MHSTHSRRLRIGIAVLMVLAAAQAVAQPPDILRSFQFVPSRSTLEVQGGFAGLSLRLPIFGTFDFVTGFRYDFPSLNPYAAFTNVEATATNPLSYSPFSFDIDDSLNLSGLGGAPLPVGEPFDVYRFEGTDGQDAPMELFVASLGRWLYLRGGNDPGCCDFFQYEIRAVARQDSFPDFNSDAIVDRADLADWESHYGEDAAMAGSDFLAWQRDLGTVAPTVEYFESLLGAALAGDFSTVSIAAPEPQTLLLAMSCVMVVSASRRGSRAGRRRPGRRR